MVKTVNAKIITRVDMDTINDNPWVNKWGAFLKLSRINWSISGVEKYRIAAKHN